MRLLHHADATETICSLREENLRQDAFASIGWGCQVRIAVQLNQIDVGMRAKVYE